jgi:hypothetical protein
VREYDRGGSCPCAVEGRDVVDWRMLVLLGVVVDIPGRWPPRTLAERPLPGVGARFGGGRRNGDSGRGSDGRFGLNSGLEGRAAPCPIVCENLLVE